MSSRPFVVAGFFAGILAGVSLCTGVLTLIAIKADALSGQVQAALMLGLALGVVLDATWLTFAYARLTKPGEGGEGEGGEGDRRGGPGPAPADPGPPYEGPDWWPEFERDFRAHLEADEEAPVPG